MKRVAPVLLTLTACLPLAACRGPSKAQLALAEQLNAEVAAANARVKLPFNPQGDTIVTDGADLLVRDFAAPLAFREEPNAPQAQRFTAFRLVRHPDCQSEPELDRVFDRPGVCLLRTIEAPPAGAYVLGMTRRPAERDRTRVTRYDIRIGKPGSRAYTLAFFGAGIIEERKWTPLVAQSLGLRKQLAPAASLPDQAAATRLIEASRGGTVAHDRSWIAELARTGHLSDRRSTSARSVEPTIIAEQADGLVTQFERGMADRKSICCLELIARLLVHLPPDDWSKHLPRILAAIAKAPEVDPQLVGDLGPRLGDAGAIAAPAMVRLAGDGGFTILPVAQGACRMGKAASQAVRGATLAGWRSVNRPDFRNRRSRSSSLSRGGFNIWRHERWKRCEKVRNLPPPDTLDGLYGSSCWFPTTLTDTGRALYLGLKRMGLGEQADAFALHKDRADYKRRFETVDPNTSADICLTEHEARVRGLSAPQ
nr:hypothetical protein [uncultured Sphingomonas sp.]